MFPNALYLRIYGVQVFGEINVENDFVHKAATRLAVFIIIARRLDIWNQGKGLKILA